MGNFIKSFNLRKGKVIVNLELKGVPLTTGAFPCVHEVLQKYLPSIFRNECFNSKHLSFYEESKETEIGHLFEHILIEYMCLVKIAYVNEVSYSGRTFWNAQKNDGHFRVEITCSLSDWPFFLKALQQSISLMDKILFSSIPQQGKGQFVLQTTPTVNGMKN